MILALILLVGFLIIGLALAPFAALAILARRDGARVRADSWLAGVLGRR